MGFLGKVVSFTTGAAIGAAGGVAASRLLAPRSGEETQKRIKELREEVVNAGQAARAATESSMQTQFRQTLQRMKADQAS